MAKPATVGIASGLGLLAISLLGCSGDDQSPIDDSPDHIVLVAGDAQAGFAGQPLPQDLRVQVVDAADNGVEDVWVRFGASGGGLAPESVQTDPDGFAQTTWSLPLVVGRYTATSSVSGLAPVAFSATVRAEAISETTQTVGTSGATVELPVAGTAGVVQVRIPPAVLPSGSNVSIGLQPVTSGTLPTGRLPLAPVVAISGPYVRSDSIITVHIPVASGQGATVAAYEITGAAGPLEPVLVLATDSNGITLGIRALALSSSTAARRYVVTSSLSGSSTDLFDTGFRPGTDDWEFPNYGSALEPRGHCVGQSLSMMWYYLNRRIKQQQPSLNGRYSRTTWPPFEYDNPGFRLASVVQHDLPWDRGLSEHFNQWLISDEDTWDLLVDILRITGRPTELSVATGPLGDAHSLVVWRIRSDSAWIADPNAPGDTARTIHYNRATKSFDPYVGRQRSDGTSRTYPAIYLTPLDWADWTSIGARWQEFEAGTIGAVEFPSAPITYMPGDLKNPQIVSDQQVVSDDDWQFLLSVPDAYTVFVRRRGGGSVVGWDQYVSAEHRAAAEVFDLLTTTRENPNFVDVFELTVKAMPFVDAVTPDFGPLAGGTQVTITGRNFFSVDAVAMGAIVLDDLAVVSSTKITGTTPPSTTAGPKDVVVTTSAGASAPCIGCFSYEWPGEKVDSIAGSMILSVRVADADNDGQAEILATSSNANGSGEILLYERNGEGWTRHTVGIVAKHPIIRDVGDVDDDGSVEILVNVNNEEPLLSTLADLRLYKGSGDSWTYQTILQGAVGYYTAVIGDADGDGDNEVVAGGYNFGQIMLLDYVSGQIAQVQIDTIPESTRPKAAYPWIGDAMALGTPQVYVGTHQSGHIFAYQWSNGGWVRSTVEEGTGYIAYPQVQDADNDGRRDLVISKYNGTWGISVYTFGGSAWSRTVVEQEDHREVRVADLDGDGGNEIASVSGSSVYTHKYLAGTGWVRSTLIQNVGFDVNMFDVGDVKNDGQRAVVVGEMGGGRIWLFGR
jgi:hypothetical protein